VKAGEVLASIDAPDLDQQLAQGRATLASAKANHDIAAITANRNDTLLKKQIVAQQVADQTAADATAKEAVLDANEANVRQLEAMQSFKQIVAPFDGIITARNTDIGALINAGTTAGQELFEVSDLHSVRIYVQVPQALSADLSPGLKAAFEMPQYPGQKFEATLVTMSNAMNPTSRSMLVQLQADNADGKLFGGTYCQVEFQIPGDPKIVRVPATALVPVNRGVQVAVLGDGDKVVLKSIQLGRDFGDSVEATAGLDRQDRVIDSPPETQGGRLRRWAEGGERGGRDYLGGRRLWAFRWRSCTPPAARWRDSFSRNSPVPADGEWPCDFFNQSASSSPLLRSSLHTLSLRRWRETTVSGKTRRLTYEGGFRD
jgi:RND family efflux transporter MFP subunit